MKVLLITLLSVNIIAADHTPIVLWHGMGDTCCASYSLGRFKQFLNEFLPGVYIHSLQIGSNTIEDFENGYFLSPNKQVELVCEMIRKDVKLKNGFHAIGFSQGSQFLRAVVQRCGHTLPPVKTLLSLGGQHQGVYGLPNCEALAHATCDYVRKLLNHAAYNTWVQDTLVQATYWHDPLDEKTYKLKSQFLSDINNERTINKTYIENLNQLEKFILVRFDNDTIVQPVDTEWFGFYAPGQANKMQSLSESKLYIKDRLGLKQLDEDGKLVFLSTPGNHLQFQEDWFLKNILVPFLG